MRHRSLNVRLQVAVIDEFRYVYFRRYAVCSLSRFRHKVKPERLRAIKWLDT